MPDARSLLAEHPIIDGHNDLPFALRKLVGYDLSRYDISERQSRTQTDLVRMVDGGLGGQFWSVFVPATWTSERAVAATLEQIDFVHRMVAAYPSRLALALTAVDVEQAYADGKIASLMGAEGGHSIASSLGVLRMLYRLGVRYLTLTHNSNVPWADAATDVPRLGGLSPFGRDVVHELNRLGMLVDLSHTAPGTMHDALETTTAPVIFSHSSARALVDHPRNVPDEVLTALATNGGVCMVAFVPTFVSTAFRDWTVEVNEDMRSRGEDDNDWEAFMAGVARWAPVMISRCRLGRAARSRRTSSGCETPEVAGVEHVGIGGDFDGYGTMPSGLEDVSCYPALIAELLDRGWSASELAGLTRGNVLRVLADAESVSDRSVSAGSAGVAGG
jgi:membrane dipeptidase